MPVRFRRVKHTVLLSVCSPAGPICLGVSEIRSPYFPMKNGIHVIYFPYTPLVLGGQTYSNTIGPTVYPTIYPTVYIF